MCGICGIIDWQQHLAASERRAQVMAMNQAMLHRGPNEGGHGSFADLDMAMRRLSIIDLAGGTQPISNETSEVTVVFNGELYNYTVLKAQLQARGHQFTTDSDTEVLVHLYEEEGIGMLSQLRGMFAFCLYDQVTGKVVLARDAFGEKPLYYHQHEGQLAFASEVKSLLECPWVPRRLNQAALPYYLRTSLVPEPLTLLEEVYSLPPGHYLESNTKGQKIVRYFDPVYPQEKDLTDETEALAVIRPLLEQSVRRQQVSDVPLGAFLSGGIDSSTVVALLQQNSTQRIKTFNVRFAEQAYDESHIAKAVAQRWDTDHQEIVVPNEDFTPELFWTIIDHVGLPFRDSSAIPTYLLTKAVRQHVTVALSGDGGDELFGGYSLFQWHDKIVRLQQQPEWLRKLGTATVRQLTQLPAIGSLSKLRQLQRGLETTLLPTAAIPMALNEMFKAEEVDALLGMSNIYPLLTEQPPAIRKQSSLRQVMYYRQIHTLPANMLIKVDRMSMANSLEVRSPFLDVDLYRAAARLSDPLLINKGKGKYLLRQMLAEELPAVVFNHPKQGFGIPLHKYQNDAFAKLAKNLLFENNPWPELFPTEQLQQIYEEGLHHQQSNARRSVFQSAHRLWMMMQLLGWARRFGVEQGEKDECE